MTSPVPSLMTTFAPTPLVSPSNTQSKDRPWLGLWLRKWWTGHYRHTSGCGAIMPGWLRFRVTAYLLLRSFVRHVPAVR